jgi:hypothetical protein
MEQAAESLIPVREAWVSQFSASRPAYAVVGQNSFVGSPQLVA